MDGMTIDEVIKYFDDDAKENEKLAIIYRGNDDDLAEMHKQDAIRSSYVAEWLRELKDYKDRQDLINKNWQELIMYKDGIEKIKMRSQSYRERGETVLASGMEQALNILQEVNADADSD